MVGGVKERPRPTPAIFTSFCRPQAVSSFTPRLRRARDAQQTTHSALMEILLSLLPPPPPALSRLPPLPLGSIALTGDHTTISGIQRVKRFKCVGVARSGQACGRSCVRACMHVCALICERPSIAPGERVHCETWFLLQGVSTLVPWFAKFVVAVGLFCATPCCLSSCLSFRLGLSILPPPAPLEYRLPWMRLLNHSVMLPCLTHSFSCTSSHSYSPGWLPWIVWAFSSWETRVIWVWTQGGIGVVQNSFSFFFSKQK